MTVKNGRNYAERDVVVIDANYKDMTHEDAIKYFDLLNTAVDNALLENMIWKPANMKIMHCLKNLHTKMI
ncbi:MAG: hypothetical protein ACLR43_02455 [Faecalibacillus faecis]